MRSGPGVSDRQTGSRRGVPESAGARHVMRWHRGLSLSFRLRLLVAAAVVLAVLVVTSIDTATRLFSLRQTLAQRLVTLATVVGENAAVPLKSTNRDAALYVLRTL